MLGCQITKSLGALICVVLLSSCSEFSSYESEIDELSSSAQSNSEQPDQPDSSSNSQNSESSGSTQTSTRVEVGSDTTTITDVVVPGGFALCVLGLNTKECLARAGHFLYEGAMGGRTSTVSSQVIELKTLSTPIPSGWIDSNSVKAKLSGIENLKSENIRSGVTILGITGSFMTLTPSVCVDGALSSTSSSCVVPKGAFVRQSPLGLCPVNATSALSTACLVNTTNPYFLKDESIFAPLCSSFGEAGSACTLPVAGGFVYSEVYGGRGTLCSDEENIDAGGKTIKACWLDAAGANKRIVDEMKACRSNEPLSSSCFAPLESYVYDKPFGGRDLDCDLETAVNDGNCYINFENIVDIDPRFNTSVFASRIVKGKNILGVAGGFTTIGGWLSGMHRDRDQTPIEVQKENLISSLGSGYRIGDRINYYYDTEGEPSFDENGGTSVVNSVDRTKILDQTCGYGKTGSGDSLDGQSVFLRIKDCKEKLKLNAVWDGGSQGNASQSKWEMVLRKKDGFELWRNNQTGLIWSSRVAVGTNWCVASGSSGAAQIDGSLREDVLGSDANEPCRANLESVCAGFDLDQAGGYNVVHIAAQMNSVAMPASQIKWRIPTLEDYELGEFHGLRFVMPDMGLLQNDASAFDWTGSVVEGNLGRGWVYNLKDGRYSSFPRSNTSPQVGVRCIGYSYN